MVKENKFVEVALVGAMDAFVVPIFGRRVLSTVP